MSAAPVLRERRKMIASGMSFGLIDQIVLSLSSVIFLVVAANAYSPDALGIFTAATLMYQMGIVILRALSGESLLVLSSDANLEAERQARSCLQFVGTVTYCMFPLGIPLMFGGNLLAGLGACFFILPGMAMQDTIRHILIRDGRAQTALKLDALMVSSQVALLLLVAKVIHSPPWVSILVLGLPPTVAGLIWARRIGGLPSFRGARVWRRHSKAFGNTFGFEAIWGALVQWAVLFATIRWASLADSAALRSIIVIFGVTNVVTNFLRTTFLSHVIRQGKTTKRLALKNSVLMFCLIGATIGSSFVALTVIPDGWGTALLGDTWALASGYLAVGAIARFAAASESVPGVLLRGLRVTWPAARVRSIVGLATVFVAPISVAAGGVVGGFIGLTVMSAVLMFWLFLLVVVRLRST